MNGPEWLATVCLALVALLLLPLVLHGLWWYLRVLWDAVWGR